MVEPAKREPHYLPGVGEVRQRYENDRNAFRDAIIDFFYDEYFRGEEGHEYTDEEIAMSVDKGDVDNCLEIMRDILYGHFGILKEDNED